MEPSMTELDRDGISVVIPTRNRAHLLEQTLDTISRQSVPVAEVIVADDGSTDSTEQVLRAWDVTSIRNQAGSWGASQARNAGLERVSTKYVAFVDSDDLVLPGAIASLTSTLEKEPSAPFAFGSGLAAMRDHLGWHTEGLIRPERCELEDLLRAIFVRNSVASSGALVRTEAARSIGGYDHTIRFVEDHHFWVRLAQLAAPVYVHELTCVHRRHSGNRYAPAVGVSTGSSVVGLAHADPRLVSLVPERLGVELCEISISAVKARRPDLLWQAVRELLLVHERERLRILRRSWRHWRMRWVWDREGRELWERRPDLRSWLGSY